MTPPVALVVARGRNGVIGRGGALPWRLSADLKRFRATTLGKPVAMGRRTWQSIGRPLPGRMNIVVSQTLAPGDAPGALVAPDWPTARALAAAGAPTEIVVIGGAGLYAETLAEASRVYLTEVDAAPDGDTWFPDLDPSSWVWTPDGTASRGPRDDHDCRFFILDRRDAGQSIP